MSNTKKAPILTNRVGIIELKAFASRFVKSEISIRAAGLSFYTILAIIPFFSLIFLILKSTGITTAWYLDLKTLLLSNFQAGENSMVLDALDRLTTKSAKNSWGWVGIFVLVYTLWGLVDRLSNSLDKIFDLNSEKPRLRLSFIKLFARRLLAILCLFVAIGFSIVVKNSVYISQALSVIPVQGNLFSSYALASWCMFFMAFFVLYYFFPKKPIPSRQALKASLIATVIFELSRYGFSQYSQQAFTVQRLYGTFSVIPLFILWIQINWMAILGSALFVQPVRKSGRK